MKTQTPLAERIASLLGNRKRTARLYNRIYSRMTVGDGYQPYGYDMPTLAITKPGFCSLIREVAKAHNSLPALTS